MPKSSSNPMGSKFLTDEKCIEAWQALQTTVTPTRPGGDQCRAARDLGVHRNTLRHRLTKAHSRALVGENPATVLPGMEVKARSDQFDADGNLKATSIRQGSETGPQFQQVPDFLLERATIQTDGNNNITQQWLKLRKDAPQIVDALGAFELAAKKIKPFKRTPSLDLGKKDNAICNLFPLADLHLGLFAWGRETNGNSWDLKTAIARYKDTMNRISDRTPAAELGIVLGGGDLLHADNSLNRTMKSGNVLDVDTRYAKVLAEAEALLVYQIELAREKHDQVLVRILPGNHDEHSAVAASHFLKAWYREDDTVTVDTDPSEFWFYQFGKTMLAGNHGHNAKLAALPTIMANSRREMWGSSLFCYGHGFHIHHRNQLIKEYDGAIIESHQSPSAQDAYHAGHAYISGRSMSSITYSDSRGEIGRAIESLV